MKINVAMNERYGGCGRERVVLRKIEGKMSFTMFGYTFAVHPAVNPDGTFRDPKKHGWVVSEVSSGASAGTGHLRRLAIENAKKAVLKAGEEGVKRAVRYSLSMRGGNENV